MKTTIVRCAFAAIIATACGSGSTENASTESDDALMATPETLWTTPSNIPVCWEPSAPAAPDAGAGAPDEKGDQALVRDAIAASWTAANPRVKLTGWGTCSAGAKGIHIKVGVSPVGPHTIGLGKELDGKKDGMLLTFDLDGFVKKYPGFKTFLAPCLTSAANRRTCLESIAIHEFGHALGFRHEQDRSGVVKPCDKDQPYQSGAGTTSGPYDAQSIMNYCKENRILAGRTLSAGDKAGIKAFYREGTADGGPSADPGRPTVSMATAGLSAAVAGLEADVVVTYADVTDAKLLPDPAKSIEVIDGGKTTALAGKAWTATANKKGLSTSAKWTPAAGAARQVTVRVDGRFVAGGARIVPVAVAIRDLAGKAGQPLTAKLDVVVTPGGKIDAVTATAERGFGGAKIAVTTTCTASARGQTCTVKSDAPVATAGDVTMEASATSGGFTHDDFAFARIAEK